MVLLYMGLFVLILSTISGYALTQSRYGRALAAREQALHVAEAGLEYYRWYLSHNPNIMVDGTGLPSPVTYIETDPETGAVGEAVITASADMQCGAVQWVDLESRGVAYADRLFPRTISARYMRPSVAEYSYIVNTDVWAGSDRQIRGKYHSNGGVRMDGASNSTVSSAATTWNCNASYGCNPNQNNAPGVIGNGTNPELWRYPVPTVDFALIAVNFATLKAKAQASGIYYGPASGPVNERGYHIIFNADGTFTLYRVTSTDGYPSQSSQYGNTSEFSVIVAETLIGTFAVPSACSLMLFEDRVWIEGTVNAKVTVVAATPTQGTTPDVFLNNNIYYNAYDGTDGLTVIAERSVLIPLIVPDNMEIHGIFIAQSGHYGRDYFSINSTPSSLDQYVSQTSLTTIGTVVSNGRTGTSWICGGIFCSGFQSRFDYYDQLLASSPPPFTPFASTNYGFSLWSEK